MKLVFVTRKMDRNDPATSFIFSWIEKLASQVQTLYVVCQEKGETSALPGNVEVHSFGKDKGYGKVRQAYSLWLLAFRMAGKADGFFIHMHPIYAIMVWPVTILRGQKFVLWYTHKAVDLKLRAAVSLVDRVLTASPESFRLKSSKVKVIGHGIDLDKFKPMGGRNTDDKFRIVSIGRISPVKDYETLIKAVEILVNHKQIKDLKLEIYGDIVLPQHQAYLDSLVKFVENADLDDVIDFQAGVSHDHVPALINESDLFVNMSMTGSLDKAVLEAAACAKPVLTSNEAFEKPLNDISGDLFFERDNPKDLAEKILRMKNAAPGFRAELGQRLRSWVEKEHNLENLVKKIVGEFQK